MQARSLRYEKAAMPTRLGDLNWILLVCVLAVMLPFASEAAESSPDPREPSGYLFSGSDAATIRDLPASSFTPYRASEHLGFLGLPVWLSVDVPEGEEGVPLFLSIKYALIDEIEVYRARDLVLIYRGGDTLRSPPSVDLFGYAVPLNEELYGERLLVRLVSHNALQLDISIETVFDIAGSNTALWVFYFAATFALLVCVLWAIIDLTRSFDTLIFWFLVRVASLAFVLPLHIGVLRAWLTTTEIPPLDLLQDVSTLLYITIAQLFDYLLVSKVVGKRSARVLFLLVLAATLAKSLLFAMGEITWALALNQSSVIVCIVIGVFTLYRHRHMMRSAYYRGVSLYFLIQSLVVAGLFVSIALSIPLTPLMLALSLILQGVFSTGFVVVVLLNERQRSKAEKRYLERMAREQRLLADLEAKKRKENSELIKMLSHEINNPLTMLQLASTSEQLSKERLSSAIKSMSHILEQCELADELQEGMPFSRLSVFDLRELVLEVCESYGVELDGAICAKRSHIVRYSREALQIILVNLFNNSEKYRVPNSVIRAKLLTNADGELEFSLINEVEGGGALDVSRLTEKYTRGRSTSSISGTGLGLYIAKTLSERGDMGLALSVHEGCFEASLRLASYSEVDAKSVVERCGDAPTEIGDAALGSERWT